MQLNNIRHDLLNALIAQTFEGFDDLCRKAHDKAIHLNKRRKRIMAGSSTLSLRLERSTFSIGSSSSKKDLLSKPRTSKGARLEVSHVSY